MRSTVKVNFCFCSSRSIHHLFIALNMALNNSRVLNNASFNDLVYALRIFKMSEMKEKREKFKDAVTKKVHKINCFSRWLTTINLFFRCGITRTHMHTAFMEINIFNGNYLSVELLSASLFSFWYLNYIVYIIFYH